MDTKLWNWPASIAAIALALGAGIAVGYFAPTLRGAEDSPSSATVEPKAATPPKPPLRFKIPVSDSQPSQGPATALVTLVQWCDFPDEGCAQLEPALRAVLAREKDSVRLVFRHFLRPDRDGSRIAHEFARAAHEQGGKFWEARALLLDHKGALTMEDLERYAGQLGLDWKTIRAALDQHTHSGLVAGDRVFAQMFEVKDANAIFVNGRPVGPPPTAKELDRLVEEELMAAVKLVARGVPQSDVYAELTKKGEWRAPQLR